MWRWLDELQGPIGTLIGVAGDFLPLQITAVIIALLLVVLAIRASSALERAFAFTASASLLVPVSGYMLGLTQSFTFFFACGVVFFAAIVALIVADERKKRRS